MNINNAITATTQIFKFTPFAVTWVGGAGAGKTTGARQVAVNLNLPLVDVPCRSDDAAGLNTVQNEKVKFTPHDRLAVAIDGPALIYIDELNRADRYVAQSLMSLLNPWERHVGGIPIHPASRVLVTINPESDNYDTRELDDAQKTRSVSIPIINDLQSILEYANRKNYQHMAAWIKKYGTKLNKKIIYEIPIDSRLLEICQQIVNIKELKSAHKADIIQFMLGELAGPFLETFEDTMLNQVSKIKISDFKDL